MTNKIYIIFLIVVFLMLIGVGIVSIIIQEHNLKSLDELKKISKENYCYVLCNKLILENVNESITYEVQFDKLNECFCAQVERK